LWFKTVLDFKEILGYVSRNSSLRKTFVTGHCRWAKNFKVWAMACSGLLGANTGLMVNEFNLTTSCVLPITSSPEPQYCYRTLPLVFVDDPS